MKASFQSLMAAVIIFMIGGFVGLVFFVVLGVMSGCNDDRNPPAPIGRDPDGPGLHCNYYCPDVGVTETSSTSTTDTTDTTGSDDEQETTTSCGDTE